MKNSLLLIVGFVAVLMMSMAPVQEPKETMAASLRIVVLDGLGNLVEGAKVTLYEDEEDFKNSENPVQEPQFTDAKGRAFFRDLEPKSYFVDVEKGDMNNIGGAQITSPLADKKMNKVNIIID